MKHHKIEEINTLVLLAGGLATRLRPVSENIPKSLIPVAGKPFIEHQLNLFKQNRIKNVVICLGYLGEKVVEYISDGKKFGLNVRYSFDGDILLGTGGAILNAFNLLEDIFFVMYGDSYLDINFCDISEYYLSCGKLALMTVYKNFNKWDSSNIIFKNAKIIKYSKVNIDNDMNYIDYGLSILSKDAFNLYQSGNIFNLTELYEVLIEKDELSGYEVDKRFYEIGSFEGITETENYLKTKLNI